VGVGPKGGGNVEVNQFVPSYYPYSFGYNVATNVHFEAVPAPGCEFTHWSGDLTGTQNPTNMLIDCDKTVVARFSCPPVAIGDHVWEDGDGNGIQDVGEPGIDGVEVNLYGSYDRPAGSMTTSGGGMYNFTGLEPGDYYLEFVAPEGYAFSPKDSGGDDTIDSDADSTGLTDVTTLGPGEEDRTRDCGLYQTTTGAPPDITVTKTADPTSVPETGGNVEFTITVTNNGDEEVTIDSLSDTHFDADLSTHCPDAVGTVLGPDESCICAFTKWLEGDASGPPHENTAAATASDDDHNTDTQSDTATVVFDDVLPDITVTKTADPISVPETGGNVEFTITVTNNGDEEVTIDSLSDTHFDADLSTHCPDAVGTVLGPDESCICAFTKWLEGDASGPPHENTATATASDNDGNTDTQSDTATVVFGTDAEAPTGYGCDTPDDEATDMPVDTALTATPGTDDSPPILYKFILAEDSGFTQGVHDGDWQSGLSWTPSTLANATDYWWKVKAKDSFENEGNWCTPRKFTTEVAPPTVTTDAATDITTNSATLNGSVDGLGGYGSVDVSFEWGTSPGVYTGETTPQEMTATGPSSAGIDGLASSTAHYFRIKATGSITVYGEEIRFTTGGSSGPPLGDHRFWGDVTRGDPPASVPENTRVDARIEAKSLEWTTYTDSLGRYGYGDADPFYVLEENGAVAGDVITWWVDGVLADTLCPDCDDPSGPIHFENMGHNRVDLDAAGVTYDIPLGAGWNLISLPVIPDSTDIEDILADIMPNVEGVWAYDNATGRWSVYSPGEPSDLAEMTWGKGYWVGV